MEPTILQSSRLLCSSIRSEQGPAQFNLQESITKEYHKKLFENKNQEEVSVFIEDCFTKSNPEYLEAQDAESLLEYLDKKSRLFDHKRIKILEVLGKGGFGNVYKAFDQNKLKFVAIKDIIRTESLDLNALRGIFTESMVLRAVRRLNTDDRFLKFYRIYKREVNQVPIYSLVMENGIADLRRMCELRRDDDNEYSEEEFSHILYRLCKQFAKLERHGISQRDVKPQNIILTEDEEGDNSYKIIDFGAGYVQENPKEKLISVDSMSALTKKYASPEVKQFYRGESTQKTYNPYLADVYSLGRSFLEVMTPVIKDKNAKINDVEKRYPSLANILIKMMDDSPSQRPQFSRVRDFLKKLKRRSPNEKKYVDMVTKELLEEKNNVNQLITKIHIFVDFNHEIAKQYCNVLKQTFQINKELSEQDRIVICDEIIDFYLIISELDQAFAWCELKKGIEMKANKKYSSKTVFFLILLHFLQGKIQSVSELYFANQDLDWPLEIKAQILDTIIPLFIYIDPEQARKSNEESIRIKKKIKNANEDLFISNHMIDALVNTLQNRFDENSFLRMENVIKKLKLGGKNLFYYATLLFYFMVMFFESERNKRFDIKKITNDLKEELEGCEKLLGKNNKSYKLLDAINELFCNGSFSNYQKILISLGDEMPFLKDMMDKDKLDKLGKHAKEMSKNIGHPCLVCEKTQRDSIFLPCKHIFCRSCLQNNFLSTEIEAIDQLAYIQCPESLCQTPIPNFWLKIVLNSEIFEKYNESRKINESERIIRCPMKNCYYPYVVSTEENLSVCEKCKNGFCVECLGDITDHQDIACKEYTERLHFD